MKISSKKFILFIILNFISYFLFSCTNSSTATPPTTPASADYTKIAPSCFVANSALPVMNLNFGFSGATWNDLHVMKVGNEWIMYASSSIDFDFTTIGVQIYRLVSSDGLNFTLSPSTPVFTRSSNPAAWDRGGVETASVVYFNNQYHLFYTGYSNINSHTDSSMYRIGHATSTDGITWTHPTSPLLSPIGPSTPPYTPYAFNQFIVAEPAAVVVGSKIHLYFAASGIDSTLLAPLFSIGVITSTDGTTWSSPQQVLRPIQPQYNPNSYGGYSTPAAIYLGGQVHLFYDVALNPFRQTLLRHAKSTDGLTGFQEDSSVIFDNTAFTWTQSEIRAPSAVIVGTQLYLWFAGNNTPTCSPPSTCTPTYPYGIGLASCQL